MKYITNQHKSIALFLAMLLLFQSCIVINKKSTVEEALEKEIHRIKIRTTNGKKYIFKWIEERDANIVSIKNTKREYIDKEEIIQISLLDQLPVLVSLDSAIKHQGTMQILLRDKKGKYKSEKFIRITEIENVLLGYKMIDVDTLTVVIPIEQIDQIKLKNRIASAAVTFLAILTATSTIGGIAIFANGGIPIEINNWSSE